MVHKVIEDTLVLHNRDDNEAQDYVVWGKDLMVALLPSFRCESKQS